MFLFQKRISRRSSRRKKIGLALGSGGPRGLAHIGVIKVLVEAGIPIDYIAGSSVGALIGGMYACYGDIYKVEERFVKLTYKDFINNLSDPSFLRGILKGEKALKFLRSWVGNIKIEDLSIPFNAVATDLHTGETIVLDKGELALSIRASSSLPIFFKPVKIGQRYLVDGGNSMPVPVEIVKKMGADIVIAVDLDRCYMSPKNKLKSVEKASLVKISERALDIIQYSLARENTKEADIVIAPDLFNVGWTNFVNGGEIVKEGKRVTKKVLNKINKIIR